MRTSSCYIHTKEVRNPTMTNKRISSIVTHVLVAVVEATIARAESSDLLPVLDKLHPNALTDSGVGLLGLNATAENKREPW
jgi:hypothetical protein